MIPVPSECYMPRGGEIFEKRKGYILKIRNVGWRAIGGFGCLLAEEI
jgi:hypothetical protein